MSSDDTNQRQYVLDEHAEVKEKWKQGIRNVRHGTERVVDDVKELGCEMFPKLKGCDVVRGGASDKEEQIIKGLKAQELGTEEISTDRSSIGSSNSGKSFDDSGSSSGGGSSISGSLESSSSGSAAGQFIFLMLLLLCCLAICGGLAYAFKKGMLGGKGKKTKRSHKIRAPPNPPSVTPTPSPMTTGTPVYLEKQVVDGGVAPAQMMEAPPPIVIDEQLGFPMQTPGMAGLLSAPGFAGYMPTPQVEQYPGMTMPQIFPTSTPVTASPAVSTSALPAYASMPQLPSTFTPAPPIATTGAIGTVPAVPTTLPYY